MKITKVSGLTNKILGFVNSEKDFTIDEKLAALRAAADTINQVLITEHQISMFKISLSNFLNTGK